MIPEFDAGNLEICEVLSHIGWLKKKHVIERIIKGEEWVTLKSIFALGAMTQLMR